MRHTKFKNIVKNYYIFLRDFFSDLLDSKIGYYASSLSWSTLFSMIPLLVILLWIFTKLPVFEDLQKQIETLVLNNLMPANSEMVLDYINTFMENSHKLGYVGVFYVTFAAILFFKNYDYIVNDIFDVPHRSIPKAFRTYTLLLIFIPLVTGTSLYLSLSAQTYLDKNAITSSIHLFSLLPFTLSWIMFYVLYRYTPNVQVSLSAALISSFITSLIWYLSKNGFILYVLHNKTYASVYGSVSTLLFFFLWIYISWAIFLHGLKFCALLNKDEEIDSI
jgi:membrane protein